MTELTGTVHRREASDDAPSTTEFRVTTLPRSLDMVRVGGREVPRHFEPGCKTCQSHYRLEIENGVTNGYSYTTVAEHLPDGAGLSARNIGDHFRNGHLDMKSTIVHEIVNERAREVGKNLEEVTGTLVDHISFARVGLQKVFERMADGHLQPDIKDGIAFATLLQKVESLAGGGEAIDRDILMQSFVAYTRAIQKHTTPEQLRAIGEEIATNPVMAALRTQTLQQQAIEASAS